MRAGRAETMREGMGEAGAVQDLRERAGVMAVVEKEEEEAVERSSSPGAGLRGRRREVVGRPWIWS